MTHQPTNICILCGKQRIVVSTSSEVVGLSTVTYTEMSCPDPACQARLEQQFAQEKEKREQAKSFAPYYSRTKRK